jgi:putative DNA primase/helicase
MADLHKQAPNDFEERLLNILGGSGPISDVLKRLTQPELSIDTPENSTVNTNQDHWRTDYGNAERLTRLFGEKLRYCSKWKVWFTWDGTRWKLDETDAVYELAKTTIFSLADEAKAETDGEKQRALLKWLETSLSGYHLRQMIEVAGLTQHSLKLHPEELDTQPFLFNCLSGTVDLRTGRLYEHNPKQAITMLSSVKWNPDAKAPRFLRFLDEIFDGDQDTIHFLQKTIGYTLTGDTREECFFLFWGLKWNGKSTLVRTIRQLLGDYAKDTPAATFLSSPHNDRIRNDLARLKGARFTTASEFPPGRRIDGALVKQITGRDRVTARFLFKGYFEYDPTFKVFIMTNHKPNLAANDQGMARRVRLVPFNVFFPPERQEKTLDEKLNAELDGIFQWAAEGCRLWLEEGLSMPRAVEEATEEYVREQDPLLDFLETRCIQALNVQGKGAELYQAYKTWVEDSGIRTPLTSQRFGQTLEEHGFKKRHTKGGNMYSGVGVDPVFAPSTFPSSGEEWKGDG